MFNVSKKKKAEKEKTEAYDCLELDNLLGILDNQITLIELDGVDPFPLLESGLNATLCALGQGKKDLKINSDFSLTITGNNAKIVKR